jgi:membrane protease YdiL (CAAX protease family)
MPLTPGQRVISLLEVLLGAFIVVGHNVLRIVPNEVPILFALFWISFRFRDGGWSVAGLRRPKSWTKVFVIAIIAALILQAGSVLLIQPLAHRIWPGPEHVSWVFQSRSPDWKAALQSLLIVWTFAALGEELGYRGYLLNRAGDLGNRSQLAYIAAMIFAAVLFGFGHFYKGPAGVAASTYSGLVLGGVYLLAGRNLWAPILAHGISDTVAVFAVFMGWAD